MQEWLNWQSWKDCIRATVSRVRIPLSPPILFIERIIEVGGPMTKQHNVNQTSEPKKNENPGALFIPAGVLTGIGVGFLINNVAAGTMIGLGLGFLVFAIIATIFRS